MKARTGKLLTRVQDGVDVIEVRENKNYRWLCFDKHVIQTLVDRKKPHESTLGHIKILLSAFDLVADPRKVLILGLGGGALIHSIKFRYPAVYTTAVELSEIVLNLAKEYFYLSTNSKAYALIQANAEDYLKENTEQNDLVFVDMYTQGNMPKFYFKPDFHANVFQALTHNGVAVYNLLCDCAKEFEMIVKLIREQFQQQTLSIYVDKFHNVILYAFKSSEYKDKVYALEQQRKLVDLSYDIELGLIGRLIPSIS